MLIEILKSFTNQEIENFGDFLGSPYFNKAKYIKNYFDKLKELYPDFESYDNHKTEIFHSLYPDREYNDATVRKLQSELLKLAEEFISITLFKNKEQLRYSLLLEELDKRKIDKLFKKRLEQSYARLQESGFDNEKYFKDMCTLNDAEILFHSMRDRRKGFAKYYTSIENLDKAYIIQKLKKIIILITEDIHFARILKDKKEIENFIKLIQKNEFFEFPLIQILYNIVMLNWERSESYFDSLKKLIKLNKTKISIEELEWAYFAMMNYCVVQVNKGRKEFAKEELEIYRNIIQDNLLLYNNTLESGFYKNIISCAVEAGNLKFAEEFKDEYIKYIFTDDKNDILAFCNANIAFAKREYAKALEILARINFSDVNQKFSLRNLSLKIFYESEMYEQALAGVDSYKQNLKREKTLPLEIIKLYNNFIILYKKLLKLKITPAKDESYLLMKSIKKTETIAKTWLTEQIQVLV